MSLAAPRGVLIVGASQAGVQLASSLRSGSYPGPITLVGEEPHLPYQRPPLSKDFLLGAINTEDLRLRTAEFFKEQDIALVPCCRIASIVRETAASGGMAVSADGRELSFDRLVLATGAVPRRLPIPGAEAGDIFYLRNAADASALRSRLASAQRVVVIGGGFIGLEVAASARKAGCEVTVLELAPRLIGRAVGLPTSDFYLEALRRRGIEVVLDARLNRIEVDADGRASGVRLASGELLVADALVVGIGVVPCTDLAEGLGLVVDNGVVVDEQSVSSDGHTLAIGDCANTPNPYPRDPSLARVRLESVDSAMGQAQNAAATILGLARPVRSVPWFWSDQGSLKLQIAGLSSGYDEVVVRGDPQTEKMTFLYFMRGELIAADCVNSPGDFLAVKNGLAKGKSLTRAQALDSSRPLRQAFSAVL